MSKATRNKTQGSAVKAARGVVSKKPVPWGTIVAVVAILALAGVVFGYYWVQSAPKRKIAAMQDEQSEREKAASSFRPTQKDPDPSKKIPGIVIKEYAGAAHVKPTDRVAYDQTPAFGGPHDGFWATCNGMVYPEAIRTENMVHSLEHGAVWIAYDPKKVTGDDLLKLRVRADGKPYMVMSPFPGLDKPVSLQAWGHQLKLDTVNDERIDQFVAALRRNSSVAPENGSCDAMGPGQFDPDNPPPFDPTPPGKDAKPMDFKGDPKATPPAGQPGAGNAPSGS